MENWFLCAQDSLCKIVFLARNAYMPKLHTTTHRCFAICLFALLCPWPVCSGVRLTVFLCYAADVFDRLYVHSLVFCALSLLVDLLHACLGMSTGALPNMVAQRRQNEAYEIPAQAPRACGCQIGRKRRNDVLAMRRARRLFGLQPCPHQPRPPGPSLKEARETMGRRRQENETIH